MDQIPKFTSKPSLTADSRSPTIATVNEIEASLETAVTLTVARSEAAIRGHVIVTFAKHGPLGCSDLLKCATTFELLSRAESEGVKIVEPALLATIDDQGIARTVYLTPRPDPQFRDYAHWVGTVTEVLNSLKAQQVGLYLCNDSLEKGALSDLVCQLVRSFVGAGKVRDISLIVGRHAYNEVLTTALSLKQELDGAHASVHVLH